MASIDLSDCSVKISLSRWRSQKQGDQGEVGTTIQMRGDDGSGQGANCEVDKKYLGTACTSKVESTRLADGLDSSCEEKRSQG